MDPHLLILAVPIGFVIYQGVGMIIDARNQSRYGPSLSTRSTEATGRALREFTSLSGKIGLNKVLLRNKSFNQRLDMLLLRSGYPYGWKAEDLLFCKEIMAGLAVFFLWRFGTTQPLLYLVGLALGFYLPDFYIHGKGTARQSAIQRQLPGFVDLTALALESGLDLMAAVERILEKMRQSPLRHELSMLQQESRLGTPRKEALQHLAFRVNLPDLHSLTSIIIQSEELGTSLAMVLRNYAEDMRNRRILRAEEIAGKAPVKLLFPMMVFFFPIVFIIIFGPLALNFMSGYK